MMQTTRSNVLLHQHDYEPDTEKRRRQICLRHAGGEIALLAALLRRQCELEFVERADTDVPHDLVMG